MSFVCSATWTAQPGAEDTVRDALSALAPASRNDGLPDLHRPPDAEQPSVFRIFEVYDDEDAFKAHGTYPHFTEHALGKAIPALANRERAFTSDVDV